MLSKLIKYILAVISILFGVMLLLGICLTIGISMPSSSYTKDQIERLFDIHLPAYKKIRFGVVNHLHMIFQSIKSFNLIP